MSSSDQLEVATSFLILRLLTTVVGVVGSAWNKSNSAQLKPELGLSLAILFDYNQNHQTSWENSDFCQL